MKDKIELNKLPIGPIGLMLNNRSFFRIKSIIFGTSGPKRESLFLRDALNISKSRSVADN